MSNPAGAVFRPSEDEAAPHESAHAVVAVRLGLPIAYVELRRQVVRDPSRMPSLRTMKPGTAGVGLGYTAYESGLLRGFWRARDTPEGRAGLTRYAIAALAGVESDARLRGSTFEAVEHADDVAVFYDCTAWLGILGWPNVKAFGDECLTHVRELLVTVDRGRAWEAVTKRLLERRRLEGHEVRAIVEGAETTVATDTSFAVA